MNKKFALWILLIAVLASACVDEKYTLDSKKRSSENVIDPVLGLPLLYSSKMTVLETMMRYLGPEKVGEYADKTVYFKYENIKFPFDVTAMNIDLPTPPGGFMDTIDNNTAAFGTWAVVSGRAETNSLKNYGFVFLGSEQIDKIDMNPFVLNVIISDCDFTAPAGSTVTVTFSQLKKGGVAFTTPPITLPALPLSSAFTATFPLSGYSLELVGNAFPINYKVSLATSSNPATGTMNIQTRFGSSGSSLDWNTIYGYLGTKVTEVSNSVPITLFEDVQNMIFEDPKVNVTVVNSFGIEMSMRVLNVQTTGKTTTNVGFLSNADSIFATFPTSITAPADTTKRTWDKTNTASQTIATALNTSPSSLNYKIRAIAYPRGKQSGLNFIKRTSTMDCNLDVTLPLYGKCEKYSIIDTIPFDYAEFFGNGKYIEFKVLVDNGLPCDGTMTMTFLEENNTPKDTIASDLTIIKSAPISGEEASGTTETLFRLKYDRLQNLPDIKKCAVKLMFRSTDNGTKVIRIKSTNTVQIKIGMKVQVAYPVLAQ